MSAVKYYGTGRRKKSIARVYLVPGTGNITVNKRDIDSYFGMETLKVIVRQPLEAQQAHQINLMLSLMYTAADLQDRLARSDTVFQELY